MTKRPEGQHWSSRKRKGSVKASVESRRPPRRKERERREKAIAKAQAEFEKAKREHDLRTRAIEAERAELEQRAQGEQDRWEKQNEKLKAALRRARD